MKSALQRLQEPYEPITAASLQQILAQVHHTRVNEDEDEDGHPFPAWTLDYDVAGRTHGYVRCYSSRDRLIEEQLYVHGREHGLSTQYNPDGTLLFAYIMDMGTGIDLWCAADGSFSEETHMVDGLLHGPRIMRGAGNAIYKQEHYKEGQRHGVFRAWEDGALEGGAPTFWIDDQEVSRDHYLARCAADPSLPPYLPEEDAPNRPLPLLAAPWPLKLPR